MSPSAGFPTPQVRHQRYEDSRGLQTEGMRSTWITADTSCCNGLVVHARLLRSEILRSRKFSPSLLLFSLHCRRDPQIPGRFPTFTDTEPHHRSDGKKFKNDGSNPIDDSERHYLISSSCFAILKNKKARHTRLVTETGRPSPSLLAPSPVD